MKRFVFLIAKQRSGTNYLRSLLVSTGKFFDCDEVVHPQGCDPLGPENFNYLRFHHMLLEEKPELWLPSYENQQEVFYRYLEFVEKNTPQDKLLIIDVKYNAVHNFNSVWQSPLSMPFLLTMLNELDIPIIHLVRKNIFRCYVSELAASVSGLYLLKESRRPILSKVTIEASKIIEELRNRKEEIDWFRRHIDCCKYKLELQYEDFSDSAEMFIKNVKPQLESFLNIALPSYAQSSVYRIIGDAREIIDNYDEVISTVKHSEFSSCAK